MYSLYCASQGGYVFGVSDSGDVESSSPWPVKFAMWWLEKSSCWVMAATTSFLLAPGLHGTVIRGMERAVGLAVVPPCCHTPRK